MDNLLIPLIIIVVLFLNFRKLKKTKKNIQKGEKKTKPVKANGIFSRINKVLEEYAEAAKKPVEEPEEEWPPKENPDPESVDYQKELKEEGEEVWPPQKKELIEGKQELIKEIPVVVSMPTKVERPKYRDNATIVTSTEKQKPSFNRKINTARLRNAIVWSEILASPVSLREEE
jgi:hypothetical protein